MMTSENFYMDNMSLCYILNKYCINFKPNFERTIIDIHSEDLVNGDVIDDLKNNWDDEETKFAEEQEFDVKAKLSDHTKKVFQNDDKKNIESVNIKKEEEKRRKMVKNFADIKKETEGVALDSIANQLRESSHLNRQIKDSVVDIKFHPKNDVERKNLKNEMDIENRIAELMDDEEESQKADQIVVDDYKDPQSPVLKDPKVQRQFQQKAEQIARAIHGKSAALSEGHHSHDIPAFVTAVSQQTITQVEHLVASIQYFYPNEVIYVFDLDLKDNQRRKVIEINIII
jgi:hypothetical protein